MSCFNGAWSEDEPPPQWWHDFGAAIPNRQGMLAVLRKAFEAGEDIIPHWRMRWETGTSR